MAVVLLLAAHVVKLGPLAKGFEKPRRLSRQLDGVGVLERVLVLRAAGLGLDLQVLHRLQVDGDALHVAQLPRQIRMLDGQVVAEP